MFLSFSPYLVAFAWALFLIGARLSRGRLRGSQTVSGLGVKYGVSSSVLGTTSLTFVAVRVAIEGPTGLSIWILMVGPKPLLSMATLLLCGVCGPMAIYLGIRSLRTEEENLWAFVGISSGVIPAACFAFPVLASIVSVISLVILL